MLGSQEYGSSSVRNDVGLEFTSASARDSTTDERRRALVYSLRDCPHLMMLRLVVLVALADAVSALAPKRAALPPSHRRAVLGGLSSTFFVAAALRPLSARAEPLTDLKEASGFGAGSGKLRVNQRPTTVSIWNMSVEF